LGPTHEEVITGLIRDEVKSYKKLPMNVYQIQTKYRDERRPRFGVLRSREFIMKDAYSFNPSQESLDESYQKMYDAYTAIFTRCALNFRAVEADSGAIGGTDTHEFMVLSDIGEDTIAYSNSSDYAANIEKAVVITKEYEQVQSPDAKEMEIVDTPGVKTIDDLAKFLNVEPKQIIKSMAFQVDDQIVVALVRGDFECNETKLKNMLNADIVELLSEEKIVKDLRSIPGFLGPVGLEGVKVVADWSVKGMTSAIVGANQKDKHMLYAVPERDFTIGDYHDLRNIVEGDPSPCGNGSIQFAEGIEVGHVFKLGTKYSEAMGATFLDENGKEQPVIMGCYGIGITRTVAAIVEQNHDENGIIWPVSVAPFHIHLIVVNSKDDTQRELADQLYDSLQAKGFDVLYDDRNERPGVKFKDADLIGLPLRLTVGKKASESIIECKVRRTGEMDELAVDQLEAFVQQHLK
jgi:prolyl-tRNA synthetase